ncbi:MAG: AraC family transcriptional regulator [Cyanobacteria bacterium P01_B01_bin.77]
MAAPLVVNRLDDWFVPGSPSDSRLLHADPSDHILVCSPQAGQGYQQTIQLGDELTLYIYDVVLDQDIVINKPGQSDRLECEFFLAGQDAGYSMFAPTLGVEPLTFTPAKQRNFGVEVIFKPPVLIDYIQAIFERLSSQNHRLIEQYLRAIYRHRGKRSPLTTGGMINQIVNGSTGSDYGKTKAEARSTMIAPTDTISFVCRLPDLFYAESVGTIYAIRTPITPTMERLLGQILSCPCQGAARRTYLERKAWELISLRLAAMEQQHSLETDLDYIHHAATILRSQLVHPPTVEALARQVGTNRLYLNQGFHQVYGTTPLLYSRECRLWQARRLLMTSELSVGQVANAVGYSKCSHFSALFRRWLGVNPKTFQMQMWQQYAS